MSGSGGLAGLAGLSRNTDVAKLGGLGAAGGGGVGGPIGGAAAGGVGGPIGGAAAGGVGGPSSAGKPGPFWQWLHNAARAQRRARVARNGDSGLHIARLQNLLNAKLVGVSPPLWVDGKFGANTESRVRMFQGRNRLAVDGLVGTNTSAVLDA